MIACKYVFGAKCLSYVSPVSPMSLQNPKKRSNRCGFEKPVIMRDKRKKDAGSPDLSGFPTSHNFLLILTSSTIVFSTEKTRNQFEGNLTWVRIPPLPPKLPVNKRVCWLFYSQIQEEKFSKMLMNPFCYTVLSP